MGIGHGVVFDADMEEYCEEHPDATEEELCRRFGTTLNKTVTLTCDANGNLS